MGTARTYVWLDEREDVIAYYSLVPHTLRREDVRKAIGHGMPSEIPCLLVARLALASRLQGQGVGSALLIDALATALSAVRKAGGRLIVVDAVDERAAGFYRHHGFSDSGSAGRLVMKASDAAATLGLPRPS